MITYLYDGQINEKSERKKDKNKVKHRVIPIFVRITAKRQKNQQ